MRWSARTVPAVDSGQAAERARPPGPRDDPPPGAPGNHPSPRAAHALGIQTAFQAFSLIPDLTKKQNLLLPYEPVTSIGQIRRRRVER